METCRREPVRLRTAKKSSPAGLFNALLFPMAVVPNLWGLWNILYLATKSRTRLPLGAHGALLVALLVPSGITLGRVLDVFTIQMWYALLAIPVGMVVYYLAWNFSSDS